MYKLLKIFPFILILCGFFVSCGEDSKEGLHDIHSKEGHLNGIDVSMYQGDVNWDDVLADSVH